MPDVLLNALTATPAGTSAGLKVDLGTDNDVTLTSINTIFVNEVVNDADLAVGAVVLTYNPPAGSTARVVGVSIFASTGTDTAEVDVIINHSGASADITIARFVSADMDTLTGYKDFNICLEDGDTLELEVTTVDATETADLMVSAVEIS